MYASAVRAVGRDAGQRACIARTQRYRLACCMGSVLTIEHGGGGSRRGHDKRRHAVNARAYGRRTTRPDTGTRAASKRYARGCSGERRRGLGLLRAGCEQMCVYIRARAAYQQGTRTRAWGGGRRVARGVRARRAWGSARGAAVAHLPLRLGAGLAQFSSCLSAGSLSPPVTLTAREGRTQAPLSGRAERARRAERGADIA